jgi:uncharacterized membrane protein
VEGYALLRFAHAVGFVALGGGLLAVFVSELRAYRTADASRFAEAAWYTATFYDALVVPGALILAASGLLLIAERGLGFFEEPWLVAMWGLFLFEAIEGNTVTRVQFRRALRRSRAALAAGRLTPEARAEARTPLGRFTHFLDLPVFLVIVWCGTVRPDGWGAVLAALAAALLAAIALSLIVPRLVRPAAPGLGTTR